MHFKKKSRRITCLYLITPSVILSFFKTFILILHVCLVFQSVDRLFILLSLDFDFSSLPNSIMMILTLLSFLWFCYIGITNKKRLITMTSQRHSYCRFLKNKINNDSFFFLSPKTIKGTDFTTIFRSIRRQ